MTDMPSKQPLKVESTQLFIPFLIFEVDKQQFGLEIQFVTQIIPMIKLSPMPQVDYLIEGIANIHGIMVPVIDVRRYLGLGEVRPGLNTPIILTQVTNRHMGLIVDDVTGVTNLDKSTIIKPHELQLVDVDLPPIVNGLIYQQGQSILLLDPRYFLRVSQFQAIHRSIGASSHPFLVANTIKSHPSTQNPPFHAKWVSFEILRAVITKSITQKNTGKISSTPNPSRSNIDVEE